MFLPTLAEPREPLRKAPREIIPGLKEHLRGSSATTATFSLFCSVIKFSKEGAEGRTDGRTEAGAARRCAGTLAAAFEATGPPQKRWGGLYQTERLYWIKFVGEKTQENVAETVKSFVNVTWYWKKWVRPCQRLPALYHLQTWRKCRGLGCVITALARARVTQPSPRHFFHVCS